MTFIWYSKWSGLHKLWYPSIRDTSTWSEFGAHGEHGDVFLFSNLGALWFSENLIRYSLHVCLREVKTIFFSSNTLIYGISRDGSKKFNIRTCEHMILGQLRMGARQAKNAPLLIAIVFAALITIKIASFFTVEMTTSSFCICHTFDLSKYVFTWFFLLSGQLSGEPPISDFR